MKRCCPKRPISVPPIPLLVAVLLVASYSTAESVTECHHVASRWRGGASNGNDEPAKVVEVDDDNDDAPSSNCDGRRNKFWNIASLFELNSEAQAGALEISDPLPPGNGRGGALVATKTKPRLAMFFQREDVDLEPAKHDGDERSSSNPMHKLLHIKDNDTKQDPAQKQKADKEFTSVQNGVDEESASRAEKFDEPQGEIQELSKETAEVLEQSEAAESNEPETKSTIFSVFKQETKANDKAEGQSNNVEEANDQPNESNVTFTKDSPTLLWWTDTWATTLDIEAVDVRPSDEDTVENTVFDITEEAKKQEALEISKGQDGEVQGATKISSDTKNEAESPSKAQVKLPAEEEGITDIKHEKKKKSKKKHKKPKVEMVEETMGDGDEANNDEESEIVNMGPAIVIGESQYISSGGWTLIDNVVSLGLAVHNPSLRLSRHLRSVRKAAAKATGLHGFLSGKKIVLGRQPAVEEVELDEQDMGQIRRRLAAIERARKSVELKQKKEAAAETATRRGLFGRRRRAVQEEETKDKAASDQGDHVVTGTPEEHASPVMVEDEDAKLRKERVREIDRLISQASERLLELACEKDELQRRPNPLYNYTASNHQDGNKFKFGRRFNFPPNSLVEDYLDDMFSNGRLVRMNHTHLWKSGVGFDDDEDESIGDDLLTPSAHANRLYKEGSERPKKRVSQDDKRPENGNGGGGSWLLRQSIGKGGSLGEKIGESAEIAGYKAVCSAVMSTLARAISGIHGINIMTHSDIRLTVEQVPDLPPISKNGLPRSDYAQEAIRGAMMKGRRGKKKFPAMTETAFLQRDAVVETLLSHCQISAPLLKLFPLAWQRALLANMITLITHVVSDFCDGIELQILGHSLTFAFKPITESDMIRHIGLAGKGSNHRRARPEEFEAAVRATAEDLSNELRFLDRWHERALGSGMLRAQIANLIARIVLTLTDEVLSGARMDLWAAQAGGPRVVAGLEYRTTPSYTSPQQEFESN